MYKNSESRPRPGSACPVRRDLPQAMRAPLTPANKPDDTTSEPREGLEPAVWVVLLLPRHEEEIADAAAQIGQDVLAGQFLVLREDLRVGALPVHRDVPCLGIDEPNERDAEAQQISNFE